MSILLFDMRNADELFERLKGYRQTGRYVGDRRKVVSEWRHFELFERVLELFCTLTRKVQCHMKCESAHCSVKAVKMFLNKVCTVVCKKLECADIFCG